MIKIEIVKGSITPFPSDDSRTQDGAELVFNGRVRATEHGENITALEYEQYEGMAETELRNLAENTVKRFPVHDLLCKHRVGKVKVGETSLHVVILQAESRAKEMFDPGIASIIIGAIIVGIIVYIRRKRKKKIKNY